MHALFVELGHVVQFCERANELASRHSSVLHLNGKAWARNHVLVVPVGMTQSRLAICARSGEFPEQTMLGNRPSSPSRELSRGEAISENGRRRLRARPRVSAQSDVRVHRGD
jgi:hypothetical protein